MQLTSCPFLQESAPDSFYTVAQEPYGAPLEDNVLLALSLPEAHNATAFALNKYCEKKFFRRITRVSIINPRESALSEWNVFCKCALIGISGTDGQGKLPAPQLPVTSVQPSSQLQVYLLEEEDGTAGSSLCQSVLCKYG